MYFSNFTSLLSYFILLMSITGCILDMDELPPFNPKLSGQCHGISVPYIAMCDDDGDINGDACTSDCKCGVDSSTAPGFAADAIAFTNPDEAGSCYVWAKNKSHWATAQLLCAEVHLQLAILETHDELTMVNNTIQPQADMPTWIGASRSKSDSKMPNDWQWLNGAELPSPKSPSTTETLWGAGEPNNFFGQMEFCAQIFESDSSNMDTKNDGKLNDANCGTDAYFLCKTPVPPQPNP